MEKENVAQIHKEFYSDVRKNEVARYTGKWLDRKMLCQVNKAQKEEHFFLICRSKFLFVKCLGARRRPMDLCLHCGDRSLFYQSMHSPGILV